MEPQTLIHIRNTATDCRCVATFTHIHVLSADGISQEFIRLLLCCRHQQAGRINCQSRPTGGTTVALRWDPERKRGIVHLIIQTESTNLKLRARRDPESAITDHRAQTTASTNLISHTLMTPLRFNPRHGYYFIFSYLALYYRLYLLRRYDLHSPHFVQFQSSNFVLRSSLLDHLD